MTTVSTSLKTYKNYRKYVIVSAALVLGGSTYAYARTGRRSGNRRQQVSRSGEESSRELVAKESKGKGKRSKKGGLKSVRYLAGLLLANMGENGTINFLLLAALAVIRTFLSNRLAKLHGFLFRAAFMKKVPLFARLISENILLSLAQSAMLSTTKFYTGKLFLHWRKFLTDSIHTEYFKNMTYYKLNHVDRRITSPEQRISGDVPKFCKELSDLVLENLNAIIDGTFYTYRMCSYTSYKYPLGILGYVLGAGAITGVLSPPFGKLMAEEQQLDGEYRLLNTRLRTHSESVAFYGGQNREASIIMQKFRELVAHHGRTLHTQWWFGMIQDFFLKYCGATWAVFLIIGPFFGGELRPDNSMEGRAEMLSNMRYHTSVVINLFQAMGTLAGSTRRLARLSGYSDRIKELLDVSKELGRNERDGAGVGSFVNAKKIVFEGVKVVTPAGSVLVEDLNLEVVPGCNLLITGPNGSGKSSLFRVLGGLWPLVEGHIQKPGVTADLGHEIFYVPQRPYTAPGTLRDQLIYPRISTKEHQLLSNDRMRELLVIVDLEYLLDRYPEDKEVNWGEELSLGEQQRLGMARLFYHQPAFAILDECTSAVTTDMEERFCERVRRMGTTCVTISHRPALVAFHDTVLALDGEGGWTVHYKEVESGSGDSLSAHITEIDGDGSVSGRQTDSATVTRSFLESSKQKERIPNEAVEYLFGPVLANSPPIDPGLVIPRVPRLKAVPQSLKYRLQNLSRVFFPSLFSRQGGLLGLLVSLVVGRTWLSDRIASLNGNAVRNVLHQDKVGFMRLLGVSVLQSCASAIVAPSLRHLTASLSLSWRVRLTQYLTKLYFQHNAYYKAVHLSEGGMDADQRITHDVEKLCGDVAGLVTGMVKPIVDIFWFTFRVKMLTGNRGVGILYAYMFLGLGFLRAITPNFGALTSQEQAYESNFRFLHSRLRTHAESVAFFGGGDRERNVLQGNFSKLMTHLRLLHGKRWAFGIVDEFVTKQLPHQVTWFLSLLYALDRPGDRADTKFQGALAHDLRFLASVVSQSFLAFGDILELYRKFLELGGGITRVSELLELLKQAQHDIREPEGGGVGMGRVGSMSVINEEHSTGKDDISFHSVDVITPNQKLLAYRLSFRIRLKKSMLVTGPNGSGKSSLFRVLGGLWPLVSGRITMPGLLPSMHGEDGEVLTTGLHGHDVFYVPQRPYMALGTLRDQIVYPLTIVEAMSKVLMEPARGPMRDGDDVEPTASSSMEALDELLNSILKTVRVSYLLEREGGWDVSKNWADILSLGEQQRLGMARLFFHRPKFGILDECTNATSVDVEESLYRHAQTLGITVVTISQRPALIPFHSTELRLIDGEGAWEFRAIEHAQTAAPVRQLSST